MVKIRGKRGVLRILEAFIAVTILFIVLLTIITQQPTGKGEAEKEILALQRNILERVSQDEVLRQEVLEDNPTGVERVVESILPPTFNYSVRICDLNELCNLGSFIDTEVFVDQTVISANLQTYSPKVVKIFLWRKVG